MNRRYKLSGAPRMPDDQEHRTHRDFPRQAGDRQEPLSPQPSAASPPVSEYSVYSKDSKIALQQSFSLPIEGSSSSTALIIPPHKNGQLEGDHSPSTVTPRSLGAGSTSWESSASKHGNLFRIAKCFASYGHEAMSRVLDDVDLSPLWTVSEDPPVTAESLSMLDIHRLPNYAKLYHDFHFENEIILHAEKKSEAEVFWAVLAVEFSLYFQHNDPSESHSWLKYLSADPGKAPKLRLHRVLVTLNEILKTLVGQEDSAWVSMAVNANELTEQISHGCCNFIGLAGCIGSVLKRSCLKERDASIEAFVHQIQIAAGAGDPCLLASAIQHLFTVLEEMKLDILHSYIRCERLALVADSVVCEQMYFRDLIERGWDVSSAATWYAINLGQHVHPIESLAFAIVDAATNNQRLLPETFDHDRERIKSLYQAFQRLAAGSAISETLRFLVGAFSKHHLASCDDQKLNSAIRHIEKIDPNLSFWAAKSCDSGSLFAAVTLEIVRTANIICEKQDAPSERDLLLAETRMLQLMGQGPPRLPLATRPTLFACPSIYDGDNSPIATENIAKLRSQLHHSVRRELKQIHNLSAADVFILYRSRDAISTPFANVHMQAGLWSIGSRNSKLDMYGVRSDRLSIDEPCRSITDEQMRLLSRHIAHITLIHWRVWDPIVGLRPWKSNP